MTNGIAIGLSALAGVWLEWHALPICLSVLFIIQLVEHRKQAGLILISCVMVIVGAVRSQDVPSNTSTPELGLSTGAVGRVSSFPIPSADGHRAILSVSEICVADQCIDANSQVLVYFKAQNPPLSRGQTIRVDWRLETLQELPSGYRSFVSSQGTEGSARATSVSVISPGNVIFQWLASANQHVSSSLEELLPGDPGALALARLGTEQLEKELEQARINLETARLRREDMLISGRQDSSDLAEDKLRNINLLSGFTQAQYDVNGIQSQMEEQLIRAPHSGVIYDIRQMEGGFVSPGTAFGSLIDNQSFRVEFEILESELGNIRTGQPLEVHPLAGQFSPFRSTIHRIIPIVNPQGLVTILAKARGSAISYYDGMKVRVLVERTIADQTIVPRDALVIRSGRQVVFTYDSTSGLAKWQYVSTGLENETSVTITEGINPGDLVITDGNLNLSHDAEVMVNHPEQ